MFLDECHLVWGDVCGYGWSRRNQRVDIEVKSTKERQTYYGALDYLTKSFVVHEYSAGNEDNTIAFLKYLQSCYEKSTRLIVIWDGVSYHRGDEGAGVPHSGEWRSPSNGVEDYLCSLGSQCSGAKSG